METLRPSKWPWRQKMSRPLPPGDPAEWMLYDGFTSTPVVHKTGCYICEDPEFALMGLPLCRVCPECGGHIAADDSVCDDCGYDEYEAYLKEKDEQENQNSRGPSS